MGLKEKTVLALVPMTVTVVQGPQRAVRVPCTVNLLLVVQAQIIMSTSSHTMDWSNFS